MKSVLAIVLLASFPLAAQQPAAVAEGETAKPARNYVNFRIGAASTSKRAELCAEVSPIALLGLEACGTGSGFLHKDPDPEIAHFRAKLRLASLKTELGWVEPRLNVGFAELQVGEDGPGFHFTDVGAGNETAGPEVGVSVRALIPVYEGFELIGDLNLGAAYFPHAPKLSRPSSTWQPNASFTLGFGF